MGSELKNLRKAAGLTQHQLGKLADIEPWRVTKAELGMIELTEGEVKRLKSALARAARENARRLEAVTGAAAL